MYRLIFCHTRGIAIISEVTNVKYNNFMYVLFIIFVYNKLFS